VIANQNAIGADDAYLAICKPGPGVYPLGYVPHNHHFLWFAATMEGASKLAVEAAAHTGQRTSDPKLMRTPGFEAMQGFTTTPLFAAVRFGHWDDVVATPKPADDLPYMLAMWNYGQAMAAVGQGRLDDAKKFHEALEPATKDPAIEKMKQFDRYSLVGGVQVAERFVAANIARAEKKYDDAIAALNTAVTIEDTLPYDEPPAWNWPSRLALGKRPARGEEAGGRRAGLPRGAEAQPRERMVAARPRAGAQGAGQEAGSAGSRRPLREGLGQRGRRPRQDLARQRSEIKGRVPLFRQRGEVGGEGRADVRRLEVAGEDARRGRSARTPSSGRRCTRRRRPGSAPGQGRVRQ
jgi:hypothetical protein